MTEQESTMPAIELEIRTILERMLADDENITVRAVVRFHSSIKAASSITRNEARSKLVTQYRERQTEYRRWRSRAGKQSGSSMATMIEQKVHRIDELEANVQVLIASHVAMLRAVGELGGFSKWASFYEQYQDIRDNLASAGAIPEASVLEHSSKKR